MKVFRKFKVFFLLNIIGVEEDSIDFMHTTNILKKKLALGIYQCEITLKLMSEML